MGCPIPYQRGTIFYYYTDRQGNHVKHGPFRNLHGNGVVSHRSHFLHGKLNGVTTDWNTKGLKTNEAIYQDGELIGWSIYIDGKIHYHNEQLFENGRFIAAKRFENGEWSIVNPIER